VIAADLDRAERVPSAFLGRLTASSAASFEAWKTARATGDFAHVAPHLERTLDLSREFASFFPEARHPADPMIDLREPGMTMAGVAPLLADLRRALVPMVEALRAAPPPENVFAGRFEPEVQLRLGYALATTLGYDPARGRQDVALHPFATRFAHGDVRITTRVREDDLTEALFSTLHEAGHGMYDQGVDARLDGTLLGRGASAGVHESQSRLWENLVGRSRAFWTYALPHVQRAFPQLAGVDTDAAYRAVNVVRPSTIRTDADEVTYNLHVIIRVDLEAELLEGRLAVRDLPDAWAARYASDLGVTPENHAEGALQDVHWFSGMVGGQFQGYALGNVLSAQFLDAARRSLGDLDEPFAQGSFGDLLDWLREHVYRFGRRRSVDDLVAGATGASMRLEPYLTYLHDKYRDLYRVELPRA
jgi:carboxypeptidase Taq